MMRYLSMLFLVVLTWGAANAKENQSLPEWMVGEWTVRGIYIEENSVDLFSSKYIPFHYDKNIIFFAENKKIRLAERGCSKFSIKESTTYIDDYLKNPTRETNRFIDSEGIDLPEKIRKSRAVSAKIICTENLTGERSDRELKISSVVKFPVDWEFVKIGDFIGIKDHPCPDCFFIFQRAPSDKTS